MLIRIHELRARTIIGVEEWEQQQPQEVIFNIEIEFDGTAAAASDSLADTINYKALKRSIIDSVEKSNFRLLERLTGHVLGLIMKDPSVQRATVETHKPHALRFARSVSVVDSRSRTQ